MKLNYIFVIIIFIINFINLSKGRSEQCPLAELLNVGEQCTASAQCYYPNVCKDNVCREIVAVGDECNTDEECGLFFNNIARCYEGTCDVNLSNGDDCGEGHYGRCGEGSICKWYKCRLESGNCTSDSECPFNHYCEENSNTCTPVVLGNQCNRNTMCPVTHICNKNECVAKYSRETASQCNGNPELCNVFNGDECDQVIKICKSNDRYGKECYVDGDCGTGSCLCNNDGNKQCVGPNTTLVHDSCLQSINSFVGCMNKHRCASNSPLTCKECYPIWECYRYNCFAEEQFDQRKSSYYKSLKCNDILGTLVNPEANNSNYQDSIEIAIAKSTNSKNNSNSKVLKQLPILVILSTLLLILIL